MGGNCACSCPVSREVGCCGRCGKSLVKILTIAFSILITTAGLAILIARVWLYFNKTTITNALEEVKVVYGESTHTYTFMWVIFYVAFLVTIGIYLIAVGILGLVFSFKQTLQFFLLSLIASVFVLLISAAIGVGLPVCTAIDPKNADMTGIYFERYIATKNYTHRQGEGGLFWNKIDVIQQAEMCCGNKGPYDYTRGGFTSKYAGHSYPYSCCALKNGLGPLKEVVTESDVNWFRCRNGGIEHYKKGCNATFIKHATDILGTPGLEIIRYTYGSALAVTALLAVSIVLLVLLYLNPN